MGPSVDPVLPVLSGRSLALRAKGLLADLRGDVNSVMRSQLFEDSFDAHAAAVDVLRTMRLYEATFRDLVAEIEEYQELRQFQK